MKIRISNPNISQNESSFLTVAAAAAATSLTVKNNEGFSADDYVVVGRMGDEGTEMRKISSVSGNNTVVVDALDFAHAVNTPITFIDFNQMELHRATSKTGTYAVVGSLTDIEVDQGFTEIEDTTGTESYWYKVRYYNATSLTYSDYSDPVQGSGYEGRAVRTILNKIYIKAHDDRRRTISEDDMLEFLNDAYQKAINVLMKSDRKRFLKKGYVSLKNSYNTGTVTVDDGETTVTASADATWSTGWTDKKIIFGDEGYPYEVSSVDDTDTITLARAYDGAGSDYDDGSYLIFQDEYDIVDASTGETVTDFRRIEQVVDEDGGEVHEYDLHRSEMGWYVKREGDDMKFCLNYHPSTADAEGRWLVYYLYQPAKLDSMGDIPEIPLGHDSLLVDYGVARIKERIGEIKEANYFDQKFERKLAELLRYEDRRGYKTKSWRLERAHKLGTEHDDDWINDIYSRDIVDI